MQNLNNPEPDPIRKEGATWVWPLVWADVDALPIEPTAKAALLADMIDRDRLGWERHGGPLVDDDGRNALIDMYQELLDGAVYAKKARLQGGLDAHGTLRLEETYSKLIEMALQVRWLIEQKEVPCGT